jgi:hypothetical protein
MAAERALKFTKERKMDRGPLGKVIAENANTLVAERNGSKSWDKAVEWLKSNYPNVTKGRTLENLRENIGRVIREEGVKQNGGGAEAKVFTLTEGDLKALVRMARQGIYFSSTPTP